MSTEASWMLIALIAVAVMVYFLATQSRRKRSIPDRTAIMSAEQSAALDLRREGARCYLQGRALQAEALWRDAVDRGDERARTLLGIAAYREGRWNQAIDLLEMADQRNEPVARIVMSLANPGNEEEAFVPFVDALLRSEHSERRGRIDQDDAATLAGVALACHVTAYAEEVRDRTAENRFRQY